MIDWHLTIGDLITAACALGGVWAFSIGVVRVINGKFTNVAVTLARVDERVKGVEGEVARAHTRIDSLAQR